MYGERVPMNDRRVPIEQMCDYLEQSLVKQKDKEIGQSGQDDESQIININQQIKMRNSNV